MLLKLTGWRNTYLWLTRFSHKLELMIWFFSSCMNIHKCTT